MSCIKNLIHVQRAWSRATTTQVIWYLHFSPILKDGHNKCNEIHHQYRLMHKVGITNHVLLHLHQMCFYEQVIYVFYISIYLKLLLPSDIISAGTFHKIILKHPLVCANTI